MRLSTLAAILVLLIMLGCKNKNETDQTNGAGQNTARVTRTELTSTIEEEGEIAPLKSVEVKSSISGRVTRVFVNEGDYVKRGQVLAEIVADREQTRTINNIINNYRETEINYENMKRDFAYTKDLFTNNFISEREYLDVQNKYRLAQLRFDSAKEEYQLALNEIELSSDDAAKTSSISSPLTGIVLKRNVENDELVSSETSARSGTVLMVIADYTNFVVKVNVNEFDIERVKHNQRVEISRGRTREEKFEGRVFKISPLATQSDGVRVYPVEIEIVGENHNLRFGMTSAVKIITAEASDALIIPITSLFVNNRRQEYVMVQQPDGSFAEKFIKRGINNIFFVQVTEGLDEGDIVLNQAAPRGGGVRQGGSSQSVSIPGMPAQGIGIRR